MQKILLIDDSEIVRMAARQHLESKGFEVVALASPIGFSKLLAELRPSLALVDLSMPGLKGHQVIDLARRMSFGFSCPIVLFSAEPEATLAEHSAACGADGYICKTNDWDAITRAVLGFIAQPSKKSAS